MVRDSGEVSRYAIDFSSAYMDAATSYLNERI